MSSIVYTTDQEMIEYHRLCGNRDVNFWRLSSRASFSDFHRGDLLFFYAYGPTKRKKGLVGYAHYDSTNRLSLDEMWKRYKTFNGYSSKQKLKEAITLAARDGNVPETMNCLYLKDCVYFSSPIYPEEAGLRINDKLESYTYLDRNDPTATVRVLRIAEKRGIDIWAGSQNYEPDTIFELDEVRQELALIHTQIAPDQYTSSELRRAKKLVRPLLAEGYEPIRGSTTDLFCLCEGQVIIAVPFAATGNDRAIQVRNTLGKLLCYQLESKKQGLRGTLRFVILTEETEERKEFLQYAADNIGL
ncbi:MAG: hypothetical protein IJ225_03435 [Solobacterium sp.]|nr:hypothetical protein [Solobacterium sp.]